MNCLKNTISSSLAHKKIHRIILLHADFIMKTFNRIVGSVLQMKQGALATTKDFIFFVLRNVLVALNVTRLDNWQLDPPTNRLVTNSI